MHRLIVNIILLLTAGAASAQQPEAAPAFGLVDLSAANFRSQPAQSAELATQASYGTPVRIVETRGDWMLCELPDGYQAWADAPSVTVMTSEQMERWRAAPRLVVTSMTETHAVADTTAGYVADNIVTDLVLGSILEGDVPRPGAGFTAISLPDGRAGYVETAAVEPLDVWSQRVYDPQAILTAAYSLTGVPYLWGGTTTKGVDCSGLVKVAFLASGFILPRNASQQATCGIAVDHTTPHLLQPADLLFFSPENEPESQRITHVAIYDGGGIYIHSSGRVRINSFNTASPRYLDRPVKRAVRLALPGREFPGATRIADHNWYFNR
ncbi:MAG: C40 family peptidase [Candidatus Amulumruptor sp.]|nr:C40 family peptidase [Candidatus Amulumruptor sp.]